MAYIRRIMGNMEMANRCRTPKTLVRNHLPNGKVISQFHRKLTGFREHIVSAMADLGAIFQDCKINYGLT